jgi:hypothetical protein
MRLRSLPSGRDRAVISMRQRCGDRQSMVSGLVRIMIDP